MGEVSGTRTVVMLQPPRIVIGEEAAQQCVADLLQREHRRVLLVCSPSTRIFAEEIAAKLAEGGAQTEIDASTRAEPTVSSFEAVLAAARAFAPAAVLGLGGGSALDVAKLVAGMMEKRRRVSEVFGIGLLSRRSTYLACLPTTSGTGSEVSPNAILLDERAQLKKGVISGWLVPDAAYCDPRLTIGVPSAVTAATGVDALTHCIEAFANRFAHPAVDVYARAGMRMLSSHLAAAIREPADLAVRETMMIGSLYGGLCLGPVNTAGVHALSYPLGGRFHVPHGAANALLLPHVLAFNAPAAPERYAEVAEALGVRPTGDELETARRGVDCIRSLAEAAGIPMRLRDWKIPESAIPEMASAAMEVTRLLKNNLRAITREDATGIYRQAW
jgi:alcohol dehydrogenase class IV